MYFDASKGGEPGMRTMTKRPTIKAPAIVPSDNSYPEECKSALRPQIESVLAKAASAGWDHRQAASAAMFVCAEIVQQLKRAETV